MNNVEINLLPWQADVHAINAHYTLGLCARATGKTIGGIALRVQRLSQVMPGCQVLLFSDTYERLTDRIVPNIRHALENHLHMQDGVDFVMYKKPPEHWAKPIIKLDKYDKVISFSTGMALCLVSLKVPGSANAFNAQAAIGDEVKYCEEEKIDTEIIPSLRGAEEMFGHLPEYLSVWMFTDKYPRKGTNVKWLLKKREKVNKEAVAVVRTLQHRIYHLEDVMRNSTSTATIYKYKKEILLLQRKADQIRKHLVYVCESQPYENLPVVGEFYFKHARKTTKSEMEFNVSFLNHDPYKVENAFYPDITRDHYYESSTDVDVDKPLIISFDYNFRIIPIVVGQIGHLPGIEKELLKIVAGLHALAPNGIEEAISLFSNMFKHQVNRKVYYVYDSTATGRDPARATYREIVVAALKSYGWKVEEVYIHRAAEHGVRYEKFKTLFKMEHTLAINSLRSGYLQKSLDQAGAIISGGETKKDKRTERDLNFPAEESTHYTEAFDHILWAVLIDKLIRHSGMARLGARMG